METGAEEKPLFRSYYPASRITPNINWQALLRAFEPGEPIPEAPALNASPSKIFMHYSIYSVVLAPTRAPLGAKILRSHFAAPLSNSCNPATSGALIFSYLFTFLLCGSGANTWPMGAAILDSHFAKTSALLIQSRYLLVFDWAP